jgi:hypothetical protein
MKRYKEKDEVENTVAFFDNLGESVVNLRKKYIDFKKDELQNPSLKESQISRYWLDEFVEAVEKVLVAADSKK